MTNQEMLDLCGKLGVGVKTQSSTIIEQQADRVRARAERDGLKRDVQPEEPKPVKKAAKKAAPKKVAEEGSEEKPVIAHRPVTVEPDRCDKTGEFDRQSCTFESRPSEKREVISKRKSHRICTCLMLPTAPHFYSGAVVFLSVIKPT